MRMCSSLVAVFSRVGVARSVTPLVRRPTSRPVFLHQFQQMFIDLLRLHGRNDRFRYGCQELVCPNAGTSLLHRQGSLQVLLRIGRLLVDVESRLEIGNALLVFPHLHESTHQPNETSKRCSARRVRFGVLWNQINRFRIAANGLRKLAFLRVLDAPKQSLLRPPLILHRANRFVVLLRRKGKVATERRVLVDVIQENHIVAGIGVFVQSVCCKQFIKSTHRERKANRHV